MIYRYQKNMWNFIQKPLPEEADVTLYIDGEEFVTFLCSPNDLEELTLGFLYNADLIKTAEDIQDIVITSDAVSVMLREEKTVKYLKRQRASGLGGLCLTNRRNCSKNRDYTDFTPERLFQMANEIRQRTQMYQQTGGVHFSALCSDKGLLLLYEDIGRHNTIDKIAGAALKKQIETKGKWLLTSGRISSEMLQKAAGMGITLVASMTTPTRSALEEALRLKITLVGRLSDESLNLYAG